MTRILFNFLLMRVIDCCYNLYQSKCHWENFEQCKLPTFSRRYNVHFLCRVIAARLFLLSLVSLSRQRFRCARCWALKYLLCTLFVIVMKANRMKKIFKRRSRSNGLFATNTWYGHRFLLVILRYLHSFCHYDYES